MKIVRVSVERFRGFDSLGVQTPGHVMLVGEPRAGRSDLIAAIRLAVDPAPTRSITEHDFHNRVLDQTAHIEVTLTSLSTELQQRFLDRLEFWNPTSRSLLDASEDLEDEGDDLEPAIRIACQLAWDPNDEEASIIRYWPSRSNPDASQFDRISRADREVLPIAFLTNSRPLNLAPQGALRNYARQLDEGGLDAALQTLFDQTTTTAEDLASEPAIATPIAQILDPLRSLLDLPDELADLVRLLPDGGSLAGLLRSLVPAPNLDPELGHLPLSRHGSTTESQLATAELIAIAGHQGGVVIVDDFGDLLDSASAERLASLLRRKADQLWLSTRRPETARSFEFDEIVRLTRSEPGTAPTRQVFCGPQPTTRADRIAHRELHRQILPAMTSRALIICEGTHDHIAFTTLSELAEQSHDLVPPEARRTRLIDAASIDKVPIIAALARALGFRTVAILDYDNVPETADRLTNALATCDAVVRLPEGHAIERAIGDVSDPAVVDALTILSDQYNMNLPSGWEGQTANDLEKLLVSALKSNGGLHAQFLRALDGELPVIALNALGEALEAASGATTGHIQL